MTSKAKFFNITKGILLFLAPLWMPIAGAYLYLVIKFFTGLNLLDLIFWPTTIGSIVLGLYSIIGSANIDKTSKWVYSFLYLPVALFVLFFAGWEALFITGQGN